MIRSFADKETEMVFVNGKSKRLPPDVVRRAIRRLEYIHFATSLNDLRVDCMHYSVIEKGNTQFQSMINGASAFDLSMVMPLMSKLPIITRISIYEQSLRIVTDS